MSDRTGIEYLDATWSVVVGCSHSGSRGCDNCWGRRVAARLGKNPATPIYHGLTRADGEWIGEVRFNGKALRTPCRWRDPRVIGVAFSGDLFHESVDLGDVLSVFGVADPLSWHAFIFLTKRCARMKGAVLRYQARPDFVGVQHFGHWYLGASVATQRDIDSAAPHLLALSAAGWQTWLSYEPALEPIVIPDELLGWQTVRGALAHGELRALAGVVVGAETGPGMRPCEPSWIEAVVHQCEMAGVPCFVKTNAPRREIDGWPRELAWRHPVKRGTC